MFRRFPDKDEGSRSQMRERVSPLAMMLALAVLIYAVLALLLGWTLGIEPLVRHTRLGTAMTPATTVAFVLCALALIAAAEELERTTQFLTLAVVLFVSVTFLAQAAGWGALASLFVFPINETERLSSSTAIAFLLVVWGVVALRRRDVTMLASVGIFGLSVAVTVSLLKIGVSEGFTELSIFSGMSLQTSVLFALLFLTMCFPLIEAE